MKLFRKQADYEAFEQILAQVQERGGLDIIGYCLMPAHWDLLVRPHGKKDLGRAMAWVCVTHVRRHHGRYNTIGGGHLYQGRFKSFPVQEDEHASTLLRFIESSAKRAKLVPRAEKWRWSSLAARDGDDSVIKLSPPPRRLTGNWKKRVNQAIDPKELAALLECVKRNRPYGDPEWVKKTAKRLKLTHTLRPPGRPRKQVKK